MSKSSLALSNLRGFAILMVVAFHSFIAYLGSQPAAPLPFDLPPYAWRANPIVDSARWFGFDLFCAFQYVYLMHLMFLLSGLFVCAAAAVVGKAKRVAVTVRLFPSYSCSHSKRTRGDNTPHGVLMVYVACPPRAVVTESTF